MKYTKTVSIGGGWAKAAELKSGIKAKIVSETVPTPSTFLDKNNQPKTQNVAKVRFEGMPEPLNVSLNNATINALVDAFGEDSVEWQGQVLTVETEKVRVAGKAVTALYLIPAGFHKEDDEQGYARIVKDGEKAEGVDISEDAVVKEEDLPF